MKPNELRKKYLEFFKKRGHKIIESAPLIPENDPTVLFTTAGMHPLVPFLLGQPHPMGKRLVNVQKCVRTGDIEEVGDDTHLTFFEMMGNWSLGDYFKKETIEWSFEFLTKILKIPVEKLAVSCFKGDKNAPKDTESAEIWQNLGIPSSRIAFLDKNENWWGPASETGPCGPDTEMFYWNSDKKPPKKFDSNDDTWVEIWNDVFMEYNKTKNRKFEPLKQKNVDTGMGLERVLMILQNKKNVFETSLFANIIKEISGPTSKARGLETKSRGNSNDKSTRIIADHLRAATFILGDTRGVVPSNTEQGYILRRLIRRAIRHLKLLGSAKSITNIAEVVIADYKEAYPLLKKKEKFILEELEKEEKKFQRTLEKGLRKFEKLIENKKKISGVEAFNMYQTYGFPLEMIEELAKERNIQIDVAGFNKENKKHQKLSRKGAEKRFKGGLADASMESTRLHTATHLLNEALRKAVDSKIKQRGSNITPERLRFDFNFNRKLTDEEVKRVENLVNQKIKEDLLVTKKKMKFQDALDSGAESEFGAKYPSEVFVYSIGNFSKEICGGPHVEHSAQIGKFKIIKQKSIAAGVRRIKAVVE